MANLIYANPGGQHTQDVSALSSISGTVAYDGAVQLGDVAGTYKLSTGAGSALARGTFPSTLADGGRGITCLFRLDTLFAATSSVVAATQSGGSTVWFVRFTAGGVLRVEPDGATAAAGTYGIAINTTYRLSVSYTITNTTTFTITARLYDTSNTLLDTVTANAGTLTRTTTETLGFGVDAAAGANRNVWFSDLVITDNADHAEPGNFRCTAKRPDANGATNTFDTTTSTTSSGYGTGNSIYVNERPIATTGARRHNSKTTTASENFATENAATGDVNLTGKTIFGHTAWAYLSGISTDDIWINNAAVTPTNGNVGSVGFRWASATSATYPAGTANCGARRDVADATDCILNECGMVIAYEAAAGAQSVVPILMRQYRQRWS